MTTQLEQAARLALEALERGETKLRWEAITALRATLDAPTRSQKLRDAGITRRPKGWDKDGDDEQPAQDEPVSNYCQECLTYNGHHEGCSHYVPDQEPVAWQWLDTGNFRKNLPSTAERSAWRPLYTRPQAREPLTDEQITKCWGQVGGTRHGYAHFARAIEAAHGIMSVPDGKGVK